MTVQTLDFWFPFFVLAYGVIVSLALSLPQLEKIATERLDPQLYQQLRAHRALAFICLVVGALWSIQNIWAGSAAPLFQS